MLKRVLRESSIYSMSGIFTSAISLFLVPLYTRLFTPTDYGVIDMLAIVATLVNLTVALEVKQAIGRFTLDTSDVAVRKEYSSAGLIFTIFSNSILAIVMLALAPLLAGLILGSAEYSLEISVNALYILAFGVYSFLIVQLVYLSKPGAYAAVNILNSLVTIGTTILMVVVLRSGVIGVFVGLLAGSFAGSVLAIAFCRHAFAPVLKIEKLREMLVFSIPLVPSSVGVFASLYVDRLAINHLMSLADVGLYGVAYRFASMIALLVGATQLAVSPYVFAHYREEGMKNDLAKTFRFFITAALILLLALGLFAKELMVIFTTPNYYSAANLIALLAAAIVVSGLYVFAPGAWIVKKTKIITVINLTVAVVNLVLNIFLIPALGILGAGLATLSAATLGFIMNFAVSQRYFVLEYDWGKILVGCGLVSFTLLLFLGLPFGPFGAYLAVKIVVFAVIASGIIILMLQKQEIQNALSEISGLISGLWKHGM